jgi:hypothetical protein
MYGHLYEFWIYLTKLDRSFSTLHSNIHLISEQVLPDFVDDNASANSGSKSGLILTESITNVCKLTLFEMNNVTALKSLSGKLRNVG